MEIIRKITFRSLLKNKKRTVVTIVGIILATSLITAIAGMAESFRASMIAYEKENSGDFHYCFTEVNREDKKYFENNRYMERLGYEADLGYALLEESVNPDKPYLFVMALDENAMAAVPIKLLSGRLPENDGEVLISGHVKSNGGVLIEVDEQISLTLGYRDDGDGGVLTQKNPFSYEKETFVPREEKNYTVVGIMERPDYQTEDYSAPGYTVITYLKETDSADTVTVFATYTKEAVEKRKEVTESLSEVCKNVYCNLDLMRWEMLIFSDNTMKMLYGMAAIAVAIIMATSVFCIHNSFQISLTEKMKLYGMLSSVGTTKKQRKKMVYTEAVFLGIIGIPLGIASGILADYIIVKVTSGLSLLSLGLELVFVVSFPAILIGVILSLVTLILSAGRAARKAGKVSPISAIRGNDTVKMSAKSLRCPKMVCTLFGIGGQVAWKNLRRARTKYRTTVISIVISVTVFIAMSAFIRMSFKASMVYYEEAGYQLCVRLYDREQEERALEIANLAGVEYAEILNGRIWLQVDTDTILYNKTYLEEVEHNSSDSAAIGLEIISLGQDAYAGYCEDVGVSVEEARDKGILIAGYNAAILDEKGNSRRVTGMKYDYHPKDIITGIVNGFEGDAIVSEETLSIELIAQTDINPISMIGYGGNGSIVVSDAWMEAHKEYRQGDIALYIRCDDANAMESAIREKFATGISIYNEDREYQSQKSLYLLICIFLYGFIVVIALIGITNIFNTITTNMELRAREFAMLKSIGMTKREFTRMIRLESIFYGAKALLIGIPLGILLSIYFHRTLAVGVIMDYRLPYEGILFSIAAVALLLFGIMRYSMGKINRKNIIDTIQNENI